MDSGLSWADQWDSDPSPRATDSKKKKDEGSSKSKFGKSFLSLKWMKDLRKKSQQKDDSK
ncbi:hypothetical protein DITRI_Ditri12bG0051200 [Diplodiscus trichospermus]